jgi:hypothetical protein
MIEPKVTVGKVITDESVFNHLESDKVPRKIWKMTTGVFGDLSFKNHKFLVETKWPFYQEVYVKDGDQVIMKFNRDIGVAWAEFFIWRHIPKLAYTVEVYDDRFSQEENILLSLLVRQWIRYKRHENT